MAAIHSALSETLASDTAIDPHVRRPGRPMADPDPGPQSKQTPARPRPRARSWFDILAASQRNRADWLRNKDSGCSGGFLAGAAQHLRHAGWRAGVRICRVQEWGSSGRSTLHSSSERRTRSCSNRTLSCEVGKAAQWQHRRQSAAGNVTPKQPPGS